jgi:hypothetical protein
VSALDCLQIFFHLLSQFITKNVAKKIILKLSLKIVVVFNRHSLFNSVITIFCSIEAYARADAGNMSAAAWRDRFRSLFAIFLLRVENVTEACII